MNDEPIALLRALGVDKGILCTVGAGGKKSTLYRIAEDHPGRVGLTATVHTAPFPRRVSAHRVIADPDDLVVQVMAAGDAPRVAFATPSGKKARWGGVPGDLITAIHRQAGFDLTLVKADGARMRGIKAPRSDEPNLPPGTTAVIPVVSAMVLGAVLTEDIAHRIDRVAAVTGARAGNRIEPVHVARLLASPEGALRGVEGARVVPVINMVDDQERHDLAADAAHQALALTDRFDRVVLATMRASPSVVAVVHRH